ncbi:MAG TPA: ABC transporter permease [Burkholderiaceae bacterium]|jgi:ABC-2 type transport system permease protein
MTALIALIRKDLILYFTNRRALLLNLVMPILLGAFFGYLFGGSGVTDNAKVSVALTVQDDSEIGKKVAAGLQSDATLQIEVMSLAEAKEQVRKGKLNAAIVIPQGFGDAAGAAMFGRQKKPEVTIFYDPSQSMVLGMVKGLLTQQIMQVVSSEMFGGAQGAKMIDSSLAQLEKQADDPANAELRDLLHSVKQLQQKSAATAGSEATSSPAKAGISMPFTTTDEALTSGPNKYNGYSHSFAGMSVQFILFMAIDAGISVLMARRTGLWNRLLASPITVTTVLTARVLSCAFIAFFLQCFIFGVATSAFGARIDGSFAGFVAIIACFALMTATFGLLIAAFGKTPEAARTLSVFATLIMVMLGGAWVPSFLFPQWLQSIIVVVPTRWAIDGLDAMTWRGLPFDAALPAIGVQLGFAVLFGGLALWRFRRDQA